MSGYFGGTIFPFLNFSQWVRYWLTLRLYSKKFVVVEGKRYLTAPLTVREKAVIFSVHLVLFVVLFGGAILTAIFLGKLLYG